MEPSGVSAESAAFASTLIAGWLGEAGAPAAPGAVWVWPFAALLLAIAILPLLRATHHWWERNRNKLLVSVALALAALAYYQFRGFGVGHGEEASAPGAATVAQVLRHALLDEYVPFLTLLFSLYVISGGILVRGDIRATPLNNSIILAIGGLLASVIGTTGASMVLIRVLLRTNRERTHVVHTVVFFIFIVSNVGGSLLPIGDPPLFLGYLRGVPFFWTLKLAAEWAVMMAALLAIYFAWDTVAHRREPAAHLRLDETQIEPVRIEGWLNLLWLVLVVVAVATLVPGKPLIGTSWVVPEYLREGAQLALVALSLALTQAGIRHANQFNYTAIGEVACLFLGIFITMQPPIEILHALGPTLAERGVSHPWQFFWASGLLSSFLDNAPTYVVFFETANQLSHAPGDGIIRLVTGEYIREDLLVAISCGAVFMGANTYIGNGPNFMVKTIAEQSGVRMPSFFGYMAYSAVVLVPLYGLLHVLFMRG